jgi:hypothetical protein
MRRRADEALDQLQTRLREGPGAVDPTIRAAAFDGAAVPEPVAGLVDKIRLHAYKVTDRDIADAESAGWSDSQLFELIVAAAAGAGLHRRDVVDRLLADPR